MDKLKYVKLENEDGSYSDSIPISVEAKYIDINNEQDLADYINENNINIHNLQNETLSLNNQVITNTSAIQGLASGSPKGTYATTTALINANPATGVYIITENGHIYSWTKNASSAVDLGVYQSVGIAENSVEYEHLDEAIKNGISNIIDLQWYQGTILSENGSLNNSGDRIRAFIYNPKRSFYVEVPSDYFITVLSFNKNTGSVITTTGFQKYHAITNTEEKYYGLVIKHKDNINITPDIVESPDFKFLEFGTEIYTSNDIAETFIQDNIINVFDYNNCYNYYSYSSATGDIYSKTDKTYWSSGYLDISSWDLIKNAVVECNYQMYKILFYDINKNFITAIASNMPVQGCSLVDLETVFTQNKPCYMIVQFTQSIIKFEDRGRIILTFQSWKKIKNNINSINTYDLFLNQINLTALSDYLTPGIIGSCFRAGYNPFMEKDICNGTLRTLNGKIDFTARNRGFIPYLCFIPKDTVIRSFADTEEDTNYPVFMLIEYDSLGNFIGRHSQTPTWSSDIKLSTDTYVRFVFSINGHVNDEDHRYTEEELNYIISHIKVEYDNEADTRISLAYSGEKIALQPQLKYEKNTSISSLHQDGCIWGDEMFFFSNTGSFKVVNLETNESYATFYPDQYDTIKPHCNSACFGNEYVENTDLYPLLYINAYNNTNLPKGTCYVHRLLKDAENDSWSTELKQTIRIGFTDSSIWSSSPSDTRPYGNFVVDTDNNYLYVYTLQDAANLMRFFKFNLPKLSDGTTIILQEEDIVEYFDVPYRNWIQGCHYFNNKIYVTAGNEGSKVDTSCLVVIDTLLKDRYHTFL